MLKELGEFLLKESLLSGEKDDISKHSQYCWCQLHTILAGDITTRLVWITSHCEYCTIQQITSKLGFHPSGFPNACGWNPRLLPWGITYLAHWSCATLGVSQDCIVSPSSFLCHVPMTISIFASSLECDMVTPMAQLSTGRYDTSPFLLSYQRSIYVTWPALRPSDRVRLRFSGLPHFLQVTRFNKTLYVFWILSKSFPPW